MALRQTLEVFYVGELRNPHDWRKLVDFAGTGHLVVTTAHAGSLHEALRNIFSATKTETPAERSAIAGRILAVVHLKSVESPPMIPKRCKVEKIIVPTLWRRTPDGVMGLMEYGLSSVLPCQPQIDRPDCTLPRQSSLGRAWFTKELIKRRCESERREKESESDFDDLITKAAAWDLECM